MSLFGWIAKNPLEAAALGTAAYFTGGAALGAMGGAGAAGATGAAATGAGTSLTAANFGTAAGLGGTGAATIAPTAEAGGLLGTMKGAAAGIKPVGEALASAQAVKGLLGSDQPAAYRPPDAGGNGSQTLAQLYQQGTQMSPEDQALMQQRLQRKSMWG